MLYQVTLSYACFGVEVENDIVVNVAPIARWMVGKHLFNVTAWVMLKKGTILPV